MWRIEISYKYNNVITHLVFDTKEESEAERDKLSCLLGKDYYDLKKNGETLVHRIKDKYGTNDVVCSEVKSIRCYDADGWDNMAASQQIAYKKKLKKADINDDLK